MWQKVRKLSSFFSFERIVTFQMISSITGPDSTRWYSSIDIVLDVLPTGAAIAAIAAIATMATMAAIANGDRGGRGEGGRQKG